MSKLGQDDLLVASLLDRLIDKDPTTTTDTPSGRFQSLRDLKIAVRRDLENLLNTRWHCEPWPEDLLEVKNSLMNYGLPDLSSENFADAKSKEQFRQLMEKTIKRFEKRFEQVRVQFVPSQDRYDRTVRFRIDAMLKADPLPEHVTFDSTIEPTSCMFDVTGAEL